MNKEQAINYLGYLKIIGFSENQINEIVKALEQEPCEDLCKSCDTKGCLFQSGIKRKKCDFYTHEKESCEDWHDVPSDEMTLGQARQAVKDLRKFVMDNHILSKLQPCEENMEDLISRKAVLNLTKELRFNSVKGMEDYCYRCIDPNEVEDLPPIQPKAKVGKWIVDQDAFSEINGYILKCHCSECNHKKEFYDHKSITTPTLKNVSYIYNYCPSCGAKMEVEE